MQSLESNHYNATTNDLKQKKLNDECCESVLWQTEEFLKSCNMLSHDISTDFYYKELIEIGTMQASFYYLVATKPNVWMILACNSQISIFRIVNPNVAIVGV